MPPPHFRPERIRVHVDVAVAYAALEQAACAGLKPQQAIWKRLQAARLRLASDPLWGEVIPWVDIPVYFHERYRVPNLYCVDLKNDVPLLLYSRRPRLDLPRHRGPRRVRQMVPAEGAASAALELPSHGACRARLAALRAALQSPLQVGDAGGGLRPPQPVASLAGNASFGVVGG